MKSNALKAAQPCCHHRCLALLSLLIALPLVWASIAASADAPLSRRVVNEHGHTAHIFLSAPAAAAAAAIPANTTTNMIYHGGPVMRNPTNYLIFWQPPGSTAFPAGFQTGMRQFFQDVSGTPFYNIITQYNDTSHVPVPNAAAFGGSWTYTNAFPHAGTVADPLLDADIQGAVNAAIATNPGWVRPGINTMYFVFTPPGVAECFDAAKTQCFAQQGEPNPGFCAYHSYFNSNTIYAYQPYAPGGFCYGSPSTFPNGAAIDVELSIVSHEMLEANTDPLLNAWYDADGSSGEIGDKCAYTYGYVAPDGSNVVLNGHPYQLQQEWNNNSVGCAKRYGVDPQRDFSGYGTSDLAWRDTAPGPNQGQVSVWLLDGFHVLNKKPLDPQPLVGLNFEIVR